MLKLLLVATAIVTPLTMSATASAGVAGPCRVTKGELQGHVNVSPPCELDVFMYNGTLNGQSVATRCTNMGGIRLGSERFQGQTYPVCYAVDY